jgi:hypothetical protein
MIPAGTYKTFHSVLLSSTRDILKHSIESRKHNEDAIREIR